METRWDISNVPHQGAYIAKRCPVVAHNEHDRTVVAPPRQVSSALRFRFDRGDAFEDAVFERLGSLHPGATVIDRSAPRAEREHRTQEAMTSGDALVIGGRLPTDDRGRRVGEPDLLVRSGRNAGGRWAYLPVDVKHHLTLKSQADSSVLVSDLAQPFLGAAGSREDSDRRGHEGDVLQLAHYHRMIEASGHEADEPWGGIVGREGVVVWWDLTEELWRSGGRKRSALARYDFEFGFRLDVIAVAMTRGSRPVDPLVVPVKIDQCDECIWWTVCGPVLEESDDVSLLPRLGWRQWRHLRAIGVRSQSDLAALEPAVTDSILPDDEEMPDLAAHIDMARARLGGAVAYRRRGVAELEVPRADVEIDIDMENSVDNRAYLWGALMSGRGAGSGEGYVPFVTWRPMTDEPSPRHGVFLDFWAWLRSTIDEHESAGRSVAVYCYSRQAEESQMRAGVPPDRADVSEWVEEFIGSDRWVDMYRVFDGQLITGNRVGLKVVAPLSGFRWRDEDPGGAQSMAWYEAAVGGDEESRRRLLRYNEDDVRATLALRRWMDVTHFPSIEDWTPA